MKHLLLAAGAAALAFSLPATAALADGYNARPAYMQPKPKPKPKPRAHAKPVHKPVQQARHKPRVHAPAKSYAAAHVQYEELETYERSVTHEVNGVRSGPYVSYSERYVAPHKGCLPQAPCGYSTGHAGHASAYGAGAVHGSSYGASSSYGHTGSGHGHDQHHAGAYSHGHEAHHGGYGHDHGAHHGGYGHDHEVHHGSAHGYGGHGAYASAPVQSDFHHGPLTGGVGYGVDGGPVYGGGSFVVVQPGGYGGGFATRGSRYSSSSGSAYSSSSAYGSSSYGHSGYGHGSGYVQGGNGYTGFKPGAFGYGVGTTGYTGFKR
jgi:hypothetical protein